MQTEVMWEKLWLSVISLAWHKVVCPKPALQPEHPGELIRMQLCAPFWTLPLLHYPYFQPKSIWSQTYGKQVSIYFIVKWHSLNSMCPCFHACLLITMKLSSADQDVTFSLVYSYYCHGHDSEKAKWHLIFSTLVYYIWSTPLAFDLWIKWRYIWKVWEQMNTIIPWSEVKYTHWNTDRSISVLFVIIWFLILVNKKP